VHDRFARGKLLIIDDEPIVLNVLGRALRDHDVQCLTGAREALELIEKGERFDLIFTDLMMPTMTGMEFYEKLLLRDPDLARRTVFLTGGPLGSQFEDFLRTVPNRMISKPFDVGRLRDTVQQMLRAQAAPA
jgi:CheY-like chemotaxis protein